MSNEYEILREVYRVVEWKDGCVFRTEYVETKWVPENSPPPYGFQYVPISDPGDQMTIRRTRKR